MRTLTGSGLVVLTVASLGLGFVAVSPASAAVSSHQVAADAEVFTPLPSGRSLIVTEITPDNVGYDNFEFFEVYNAAAEAIDLTTSGVGFDYSYVDSDVRTKDVPLVLPAGTSIAAGETVVFWLDYATETVDTSAFTVDDFRAHFSAAGDYQVVRVTGQGGLANTGNRGIRVTDASDASIGWSFYPADSVGTDKSTHFGFPADEAAKSMALLSSKATPTPGTIDLDAVLGEDPTTPTPEPTPTAEPTETPEPTPTPEPTSTPEVPAPGTLAWPLVVTEITPDNASYDNFEFFEVYNTGTDDIDLSAAGIGFRYIYVDTDDRTRDVPFTVPAGTVIHAGETAVFWLQYTSATVDTLARTIEQFRAHFSTPGEYQVIRITGQDGMANGGDRGIRIVDESDASIGWSYYPAASAAADKSIHFRVPASQTDLSMDVLATLATPTPGVIDPLAALTPAETDPGTDPGEEDPDPVPDPDPSVVTAPLQITELTPDTSNVGGADAYEFIEVYNATDSPVDFGDYSLKYLYPNGDLTNSQTTLWPAEPADVVIEPGRTLTVWVKNGPNDALTATDFNGQFGTDLTAGANLVETHTGGMANSGARGMEIVTNTGFSVNRAYYNLDGADDVNANQGIQYASDAADLNRQSLVGPAAASPGHVDADQVPGGLMIVPADSVSPLVTDNTATVIDPAADFPIALTATDNVQVRTLDVHLKSNVDDDYRVVTLLAGEADAYSYSIPSVDLTGKRWLDYFVTASDGTNVTTTEVTRVNAEGVDDSPVRLNLDDDQLVFGTTHLSAAGESSLDGLSLNIDGQEVDTESNLESEPHFVFEAGGVNVFFRNGVLVGDDILSIFDWGIPNGYETISVPVPLEHVNQGEDLTVSVYAGTKAGPFVDLNENNDNFTIRNLRLVLPDGRTVMPHGYTNPSQVIKMGDSSGALDFFDSTFTLPDASFVAISHEWDTTAVGDGEHVVSASKGSEEVSRTVIVDNSAPEIGTELVEGTEYRGAFTIDATATDALSGVASLSAALDGSTVELPYDTSSVELNSGTHTVVFTSVDQLGNEGSRTITFTTPDEQPGTELVSPADEAIVEEGDVDLTATATDPKGDQLDVSFNEGSRLEPTDAAVTSYSGETGVAAGTDRADRQLLSGEDLEKMTGTDGLSTSISSETKFPYEMFEVAIPENAGDDFQARLAWAGSANADAKVLMYVLNATTGAWEEIDRYLTTDGAATDFTLDALVPAADHVADGKMTVLVQHSEGFAAGDLNDRSSAVVPYSADATARSDYDFTFAWESDTQYYNQVQENYPHQLKIHQFVLDQRENLNLQYLFHTGDIVNNADQAYQWENADPAYDMLDNAGLPYGVLAGNHDVLHQENDYSYYSQHFGAERYSGNPWWGGDHKDNRGHYDLISAGGIDFMMLYMGWGAGDDEIAWMNEVIKQYPERKVMINLHEFMQTTGGLGPIPQRVRDEVVATNPNVITVFSGHYHDAFTRSETFDDNGDGTADREVSYMLFDFQGLPEGGQGYLRLLHFDNQAGQFTVRTYSPSYDDYDSEDPTLEQQHQEFTVPYPTLGIVPQTKTLATDSFEADILTTNEIESFADVASGTALTATWPALTEGAYGWYVRSADAYGAVDYSQVRSFSVIPGTEEPEEPEEPGEPGDPQPVPDEQLVDGNRGDVDVPASVTKGSQLAVEIPGHVGETVNVWLHSAPLLLGSVTVGQAGFAVVTLPADVVGTHRIVVQSEDGSLIGWDGLQIVEPQPSGDGGQTPGDNGGQDDGGQPSGGDALAETGADPVSWLVLAAALLALGSVTLVAVRRRRAARG